MRRVAVLFLLTLTGCAGTFESARSGAPVVRLSSPERCHALSERQYWFTGSAVTSGAVAAAAAGLSLPAKDRTTEIALKVTAVTAGAVATGTGRFGANAGIDYQRECTTGKR